ncbi:hypothetical protein ABZ725_14185 [Streptomyces sp. NPDC006872]|uniref:hypothetical protein n=1 Tax=Streptomyces sp. NPDC006872 TaxID=3155720 RepID=UPI0033F8B3FA
MTDQTPPTDQQLADIETRANAATPGPWCTDSWEIYQGTEYEPGMSMWIGETCRGTGSLEQDRADATFVAAARTDVPALITELRRALDRVAELEAYANGCDAEGCAIPHSSWCDAAKKSAAENDGCTCGQPWKGHPQPHAMHCWKVNPPRSEIDEMRRALAAMRDKTLSTEADEIVAYCPDHGPQEQPTVWMVCHCPVADDMRRPAVSAVSGAADSRQP